MEPIQENEIKNINFFKNKEKFDSELLDYNKKIHRKNKESQINSEIKIFEKPSSNQGIKNNDDKNDFLKVISRQKNSSNNNIEEIIFKQDEMNINKEKIKNKEQKTFQEKKLEENLESKYGKGYKILKMAGYKLGKGLGKEEQGITDPILVKKRKERAGINNEKENEEEFDIGKDNNFILGKKRKIEENNYEETNEEFKNFDLLLEEYNKKKNNEKVWKLLDEDRKIKKKSYGKGGKSFGFSNFRKKFKSDFPELKGKEIIFKNIENNDIKEKFAKMVWVTKDKIIDKLRQYYENENNKFIYEKIHQNTDTEKSKISGNLEDENLFLKNLMKNEKLKKLDKNSDLLDVINYIKEYSKLYDSSPILYKKLFNKLSLHCLKKTIIFLEEMNLDIKIILDKDEGKQISTIFSEMKKLLNNTFNFDDNYEKNDDNDKYLLNVQKGNNFINNLEKDEKDKANDYYNMFISKILLNKLIFFIENQWDVRNSKPIINICHLYSDILSKYFIDILNKKISIIIINYLNKNYNFIFSKNEKSKENLEIHSWIHPLLDILSLEALADILRFIEQKIKNSIKTWDLNNLDESKLLINLLSPWSKLFGEEFWKDLYKKFFSPKIHKMFSELNLNIYEKIENIQCLQLIFALKEKKIIPSKKCLKILKNDFIEKLRIFINNWIRKNKNNYEKCKELSNWLSNSINYFKTKNSVYEEIKNDLDECLLLINNC